MTLSPPTSEITPASGTNNLGNGTPWAAAQGDALLRDVARREQHEGGGKRRAAQRYEVANPGSS